MGKRGEEDRSKRVSSQAFWRTDDVWLPCLLSILAPKTAWKAIHVLVLACYCLLASHRRPRRSQQSFLLCTPPPLLLAWNGRRKESLTRRRRRLEWASFLGWMLQQGRTTNCFRPINLSNCEDSTRQPVHISNNYTRQLEATLGIDTSKHWRLCLPTNDGRQALLRLLSSRMPFFSIEARKTFSKYGKL